MGPIAGIGSTAVVAAGSVPRHETPLPREPKVATSRALIPLQPIASGERPIRTHADAAYLAHLIATDQKVPQTRERRRAAPQDAIAAYAAATVAPAASTGGRLRRAM